MAPPLVRTRSPAQTSASTVGLPRESRISRPITRVICTSYLAFALCPLPLTFGQTIAPPRSASASASRRLLADRADQRLIVGGHDDDAAVGDGVAAAILFRVEADERAARNEHVAIDDRAADARVPPDAHAGHQDRLLDVTEAVDPHVRAQDAADDAAARDDAAAEMTESSAWPHRRLLRRRRTSPAAPAADRCAAAIPDRRD